MTPRGIDWSTRALRDHYLSGTMGESAWLDALRRGTQGRGEEYGAGATEKLESDRLGGAPGHAHRGCARQVRQVKGETVSS